MPNKPEIIAWDTCVIIDAIQKSDGKWEKIAPFVTDAENDRTRIVVSEISVVECSRLKESAAPPEEQHKLIDSWFESPYVVRRPIHPGITRAAVQLARAHKLGAADAIVLATALNNGASILHTGDGKTRKRGGKLIPLNKKLGNPPMIIAEPDSSMIGPLFANAKEKPR